MRTGDGSRDLCTSSFTSFTKSRTHSLSSSASSASLAYAEFRDEHLDLDDDLENRPRLLGVSKNVQ